MLGVLRCAVVREETEFVEEEPEEAKREVAVLDLLPEKEEDVAHHVPTRRGVPGDECIAFPNKELIEQEGRE